LAFYSSEIFSVLTFLHLVQDILIFNGHLSDFSDLSRDLNTSKCWFLLSTGAQICIISPYGYNFPTKRLHVTFKSGNQAIGLRNVTETWTLGPI
jgi:hypothetical protein